MASNKFILSRQERDKLYDKFVQLKLHTLDGKIGEVRRQLPTIATRRGLAAELAELEVAFLEAATEVMEFRRGLGTVELCTGCRDNTVAFTGELCKECRQASQP